MKVVPLDPAHLETFTPDPRMKFPPTIGYDWSEIARNGWAYTIMDETERVVGAAGLYQYDEERPRHAEMWAIFSPDAGRFMAGVTRRTLAVLDASRGTLEHIRAHVDGSFPQAIRWVLLLGFARDEQFSGASGYDRYVWVS